MSPFTTVQGKGPGLLDDADMKYLNVKYALLSSPYAIEFLATRLLPKVSKTQPILHQIMIQEIPYHVSAPTSVSKNMCII